MGREITPNERQFLVRIGKLLKYYRKSKNLTQKQVAKKINISADDISLYENGKKDINLLTLKKFCILYKQPMYKFLHSVEGENDSNVEEKARELKDLLRKSISIATDLTIIK